MNPNLGAVIFLIWLMLITFVCGMICGVSNYDELKNSNLVMGLGAFLLFGPLIGGILYVIYTSLIA